MTDAETMHTADLLRRIAGGHTIMVVKHDMDFVRALDVEVTVLHEGFGPVRRLVDHVSADPRVIETYLGRDGAGKTSLMRLIAGQQTVSSGGIAWE
ncbi:MAG: hypothetical protein AAF415_11105 [Pseudomonadota bacterium]